MAGPLEGVRVVEMAGIGPGPFCGMVLADMGADVVVIDRPGTVHDAADITARGKRMLPVDLQTSVSYRDGDIPGAAFAPEFSLRGVTRPPPWMIALRLTRLACAFALTLVRLYDRFDQSWKAMTDLLASGRVPHLDAGALAADQSGLAQHLELV